jgi:hypothetical protein
MAYCSNCGSKIDRVIAQHSDDAPSVAWATLCFCFPLLGLILFIIWKDQTPKKAKSCGKGALIGVIVVSIFFILVGEPAF